MAHLRIEDHSEALRYIHSYPGKLECKALLNIWNRYERTPQWENVCFCSKSERTGFIEEFLSWFSMMENNLGND